MIRKSFARSLWFKDIDERLAFLLPDGAMLVGAAATDVFLDGLEQAICSSASLAIGAGRRWPARRSYPRM
jgi:hypothetical protein